MSPPLLCAITLALAAVTASGRLRAEEPAAGPAPISASAEGIGAAAVPGFLVHGTGLWVRGDRVVAKRLLWIELAGLGVGGLAGGILGATGASRRIAGPLVPFAVTGVGLFVASWLADIYGSAGGGRRLASPRLETPRLAIELGGFYVRDPIFDYDFFSRASARAQLGAFRIEPELAIGLGGNNQRLLLRGAYRLIGPGGQRPSGDASALEFELAARSHRYGREGFTATSGEALVRGRLDGRRVGGSLAGSFFDLEGGYGLEATRFATGEKITDLSSTLALRFAYGLFLGNDTTPVRGEASFYYDHRRDEFAGGLSPGDRGGGFFGYFGLELDLDIGERFGVASSFEWGSAQVLAVSLRGRFGEESP